MLLAGLLVGGGLLSLADGVRALHRARAAQSAGAQQGAERAAAPREGAISAANAPSARHILGGLAADRASASGVRTDVAPLDRPGDPSWAARMTIDATADERALRAFAAALESGRPAIRLVRWSLKNEGGDRLRLRGEAAAAWRVGPPSPPVPAAASPPPFEPAFAADGGDAPASRASGPTLVGIVGRVPGDAVAMLRLPSGQIATLGVGGRAGGWVVREIAADRVRLEQSGRQRTIVLPRGD